MTIVRDVFNVVGTLNQVRIVTEALNKTTFPFEWLLPSLSKEGKRHITIEWADLSRFALTHAADDSGLHGHDGAILHTIEREVGGRWRVLGLFYLPPFTKIVLSNELEPNEPLTHEVLGAENGHNIDYHFMKHARLRRFVWNLIHPPEHHVPVGETDIPEEGDINHGHSWFDGPAGYGTWVGETIMELFVRAFMPGTPVTIRLQHPITEFHVSEFRRALMGPRVFGNVKGTVYHRRWHPRLVVGRIFFTPSEARAAGLRPCRFCLPT